MEWSLLRRERFHSWWNSCVCVTGNTLVRGLRHICELHPGGCALRCNSGCSIWIDSRRGRRLVVGSSCSRRHRIAARISPVFRGRSLTRFHISDSGDGAKMGTVAEPRFFPADFDWNRNCLRPDSHRGYVKVRLYYILRAFSTPSPFNWTGSTSD